MRPARQGRQAASEPDSSRRLGGDRLIDLRVGGSDTLLEARGAGLTSLIEVLDAHEQEQFADLLGKLLTRLYSDIGSAELLCRLCDRAGCTRGAVCPVGQAERDRGS